MEIAESEKGSAEVHGRKGKRLLISFCLAAIAAICTVMFHQLMVGLATKVLGYTTHITFGEVAATPVQTKYWSNNRILFLYGLPTLGMIALASIVLVRLRRLRGMVSIFYLFAFYCAVYGLLFITAQLTVSALVSLFDFQVTNQGFTKVAMWFDLPGYLMIIVLILSLLLNLMYGYLSFPIIYKFRPSSEGNRYTPEYQARVVREVFVYPQFLAIPVLIIMAFPDYEFFFSIMILEALVWLPGLFIGASELHHKYDSRKRIKTVSTTAIYLLLLLLAVLMVAVRLMFR